MCFQNVNWCLSSKSTTPLYTTYHEETPEIRDLSDLINKYRNRPSSLKTSLPERYQDAYTPKRRVLGVVIFAVVISALVMYVLLLKGDLNHFPERLIHSFKSISYTKLAIGGAVASILVIGALIVIHRALTKKDSLIQADIGKLRGHDHIEEVVFVYRGKNEKTRLPENKHGMAYIDKSTIVPGTSGKAFLYGVKTCKDHYSISTTVSITTPLYLIGTVALDALRVVAAPLFVAGCFVIERFRKGSLFEKERKFELRDIPCQLVKSIERLVKAPFYATAYMFAAIWSIVVDPFNGRKLASFIERDWNEGTTRAEGFWSVQGRQELWPGWKMLSPEGLYKSAGYYWAGCWQPIGVVEYDEKGEIIAGKSLSKAVDPEKGHEYHIFTRSEIESKETKTLD